MRWKIKDESGEESAILIRLESRRRTTERWNFYLVGVAIARAQITDIGKNFQRLLDSHQKVILGLPPSNI